MTTDDIDRMLTDMKAAGFGGAFVRPRPGMITDYLSDDWFSLYKYSVEKGNRFIVGKRSYGTVVIPPGTLIIVNLVLRQSSLQAI